MAVENSQEFHKENIKQNKKHYTLLARSTGGKVVHGIQRIGARMHFNHISLENEWCKVNSGGKCDKLHLRYGVINTNDLLRDLEHWETLLTSSFMQRPHDILIKGNHHDEV